jgi:hypothetical protein
MGCSTIEEEEEEEEENVHVVLGELIEYKFISSQKLPVSSGLSSVGAAMFRAMMLHQRPLTVIHGIFLLPTPHHPTLQNRRRLNAMSPQGGVRFWPKNSFVSRLMFSWLSSVTPGVEYPYLATTVSFLFISN